MRTLPGTGSEATRLAGRREPERGRVARRRGRRSPPRARRGPAASPSIAASRREWLVGWIVSRSPLQNSAGTSIAADVDRPGEASRPHLLREASGLARISPVARTWSAQSSGSDEGLRVGRRQVLRHLAGGLLGVLLRAARRHAQAEPAGATERAARAAPPCGAAGATSSRFSPVRERRDGSEQRQRDRALRVRRRHRQSERGAARLADEPGPLRPQGGRGGPRGRRANRRSTCPARRCSSRTRADPARRAAGRVRRVRRECSREAAGTGAVEDDHGRAAAVAELGVAELAAIRELDRSVVFLYFATLCHNRELGRLATECQLDRERRGSRRRRRARGSSARPAGSSSSVPFAELTVDAVMAEAGLARTVFYRHYDDLPEMAADLLPDEENPLIDQVDEVEGTQEKLEAMIRGLVDVYAEHGPLLRAIDDAARADSSVAAGLEPALRGPRRLLADLVATSAHPPPNPREFARLLMATHRAYLLDTFGDGRASRGAKRRATEALTALWSRLLG